MSAHLRRSPEPREQARIAEAEARREWAERQNPDGPKPTAEQILAEALLDYLRAMPRPRYMS